MLKQQFLNDLEDILQREEPCTEKDNLDEYEEWDSLSQMSLIAYMDRTFGVKLGFDNFENVKTVADLIELAGGKIGD